MSESEEGEMGGWVLQRVRQVGLIAAGSVGGSEGDDGDKIGL